MLKGAPASLEMDTAAFGFFAASLVSHLHLSVHLDAGVTAALLVETQSIQVKGGDDDADDELTASTVDTRFGALARLSLGGGPWRFITSLDADFSPSRTRRTVRIDPAAPALPGFGLGLTLGTSWGSGDR